MRVLIISQYFWPESFRINDLVIGLKERGHEITILTGKPNYPIGAYFKGYSFLNKPNEEWEGITIKRVPLISRGKGRGIRLLLNYFSFSLFASFKVFFLKKDFDIAFVFEPSPITVGIPAVVLRKLFNKPYLFWVQDLWPESITAAAGIKNSFVINFFNRLTKLIYNNANLVLVQSKAFIPYIQNQGIAVEKIKYFPNSTESFQRNKHYNRLSEFNIPDGFNLMFAGNLGKAQSFETLLASAKILKDLGKKVNWIILGDGRMREFIEKQIEILQLNDTFFLLGMFPVKEMPSFYGSADALLLSLKRDKIFSYTIPSKLQSYLAFGKPIIASIDGEGALVIKEAQAGFVGPAEDVESLVENIIKLIETDSLERDRLSQNAIFYYEKEFERETLLNKLEVFLQNH